MLNVSNTHTQSSSSDMTRLPAQPCGPNSPNTVMEAPPKNTQTSTSSIKTHTSRTYSTARAANALGNSGKLVPGLGRPSR